jgi:hypothetical protein
MPKVSSISAALVEQAALRRPLHRKPAQYKRTRCEAEVLASAFPLQTNALDGLYFTQAPLREDQIGMSIGE